MPWLPSCVLRSLKSFKSVHRKISTSCLHKYIEYEWRKEWMKEGGNEWIYRYCVYDCICNYMYGLNKWMCDIFCSRICFLSVPQGFRSDWFLWHPELPFFTKARRRHPVYQTQDATSTDLQMQSSEIWAKSFKATFSITSEGFINDYSLLMSTDVCWKYLGTFSMPELLEKHLAWQVASITLETRFHCRLDTVV